MGASEESVLDIVATWLLEELRRKPAGPLVVAVSGPQGSGKTTLLRQLCRLDTQERIEGLSLDDFYLSKASRKRLAEQVHPLFETRGVPMTHDVLGLQRVLTELQSGAGTLVPQFDKAMDDLASSNVWRRVAAGPIDAILVEGWCLSIPPAAPEQLREPINQLERLEDGQGIWRQAVNQRLAGDYHQLFQRFDRTLALVAPSFEVVHSWRLQQEQELARDLERQATVGHHLLLTGAALSRFLAHFERLTRRAQRELPKIADLTVFLDEQRRPRRVERRRP